MKLRIIFSLFFCLALMLVFSACNEITPDDDKNSDSVYHTVTFVTHCDVTIDPLKVKHGEKVAKPQAIEKTGYSLEGWYLMGEKWSFIGHVVTEDITLEANWIGNENVLRFDGNGATGGAMMAATIRSGETIQLPECSHTMQGYRFTGWATKPDGVAVYQSGDYYKMGTNSEYTLYAVWKPSLCPEGTHIFPDWEIEKEATCSEKGVKLRKCIVCTLYVEKQAYADYDNHKYENGECIYCGHSTLVTGNHVGNLCPSYSLEVFDANGYTGTTIGPSNMGRLTIINFWGTWCGECIAELPYFDQIANEYKDTVAVIAVHTHVSFDEAVGYVNSHYNDSSIIFAKDTPVDMDDIFSDELYFKALGGKDSYPVTIVLDERGVIIASISRSTTYNELKEIIENNKAD